MITTFDIAFWLGAGIIIGLTYYIFFGKKKSTPKQNNEQNNNYEIQEQNDNENQENESDDEGESKTKTKKDLRKEQKKAERREQQEARRQQLEFMRKKEEERQQKQEELDRQEEEKEKQEEERQKQLEEEKIKKEEEIYQNWKTQMIIEEQGEQTQLNDEDKQNKLQKFIDYIKLRKMVQLEDLAVQFKLQTKNAIDRIKQLEDQKKLNGVFDERGKYLYITEQEMQAVLNLIKTKGSISKTQLMIELNSIIRTTPSQQNQELIKKEEENMLEEANIEFSQIEQKLEQQ